MSRLRVSLDAAESRKLRVERCATNAICEFTSRFTPSPHRIQLPSADQRRKLFFHFAFFAPSRETLSSPTWSETTGTGDVFEFEYEYRCAEYEYDFSPASSPCPSDLRERFWLTTCRLRRSFGAADNESRKSKVERGALEGIRSLATVRAALPTRWRVGAGGWRNRKTNKGHKVLPCALC